MILNPNSNSCITYTDYGQSPQVLPCDFRNPKQLWTRTGNEIRSQYDPNNCLDKWDDQIIPGKTSPKIWRCNSSINQQFDFNDSHISIQNNSLDIMDPSNPQLIFWNKLRHPNQQWIFDNRVQQQFQPQISQFKQPQYQFQIPQFKQPQQQYQPQPQQYQPQQQYQSQPKYQQQYQPQPQPKYQPQQQYQPQIQKPKQPQPLPSSLKTDKIQSRSDLIKSYITDQETYKYLNEYILQDKPESVIRLATYNVHYWSKPHRHAPSSIDEYRSIMNVIKEIKADILVLEEVSTALVSDEDIEKDLKSLGFQYSYFCEASIILGGSFRNYIVSRYPFVNKQVIKLEKNVEGRCAVFVTIQLPKNKKITIIGTHLDVYDETEQVRSRQIKEILQFVNSLKVENIIITGDFNSLRRKDYEDAEWKRIETQEQARNVTAVSLVTDILESAGWKTSFEILNTIPPKSTVWPGRTVDHIYLKSNWSYNILGSYVYHDPNSDHIPVLMDFTV